MPVSACQPIPYLSSGMTSTWASEASCSLAKASCQPAGVWPTLAAGSGKGTSGRMAKTTTPAATYPPSPQARPRTVTPDGEDGDESEVSPRARSKANASRAATAPSARMESRSGRASASTGRPCSQCHGSSAPGYVIPWKVTAAAPRENSSSSANVTAVSRTFGSARSGPRPRSRRRAVASPGRRGIRAGAQGSWRQRQRWSWCGTATRRRGHEGVQIVVEPADLPRAAVRGERAAELHPQRVPTGQYHDRDRGAEAGDGRTGMPSYSLDG